MLQSLIKILPSKISHYPPLGRDVLPIPLNVIWKTLLGTSSLCISSSILNCKSTNQGIELQNKGSFKWVMTLQLHPYDPGSNLSLYLAVLRSALTRLFLPSLVTKLLATNKLLVLVLIAQSLRWGSQIIHKKAILLT